MTYNDYDQTKAFHQVCQDIVDNQALPSLNYAVNYAKAGLGMTACELCRVQAMYIVSNITHWRGDMAKKDRVTLKDLIKYWKA